MKKNIFINWIDCDLYTNNWTNNKSIVIYIHGFANNKDSSKAQIISDFAFNKNYDYLNFSFKWNWNSCLSFNEMSLSSNINDIWDIIKHIDNDYSITFIASSFGASALIWFLNKKEILKSRIKKIILLAPVLKLQDKLQDKFWKDFREKLKNNFSISFYHFKDKKNVFITNDFLSDLEKYDLEKSLIGMDSYKIIIIHWTQDNVISIDNSKHYLKYNKNINLITCEDDHNLSKNLHLINNII